ncbi:YeiH family protein [Priestia taiwanensis]|uniref:Membrane protein n=1 Tax=Priestia taiwanensis TaxID=1347902 RepID=A0A917ASJ3_9BACI|nr:putative sulfate exporter family transporter [Priestia taiwanensis]MBM7363030.1 putative integral membrane protein (TIGR00698 family) [Priestia taiwanensis]GGE67035.1 membrane protein [Priestia taiwanensis]
MNKQQITNILPGLAICICIALLSTFLGTYIQSIGSATIAILLGIIAGNTCCKNERFTAGTKFAEGTLLSCSIVLLGTTIHIQALFLLGVYGVGFILMQLLLTIVSAIWIGKKLGFSENFQLLMASGNGVCGSSAIASTAPVIGANDTEKGISITIVNLLGTVLMLLLPLVATVLYNGETNQSAALLGGILQSVGQVVASGSLMDESIKELALLFKVIRILFLVVVVLSFSYWKQRSGSHEQAVKQKKTNIPWYIIGFFLMCTLFSLGVLSPTLSHISKSISGAFELIALAGIGMHIKIDQLIAYGMKASLYGLCIGLIQIGSAILLIYVLL